MIAQLLDPLLAYNRNSGKFFHVDTGEEILRQTCMGGASLFESEWLELDAILSVISSNFPSGSPWNISLCPHDQKAFLLVPDAKDEATDDETWIKFDL